jgi:hypothetical protein
VFEEITMTAETNSQSSSVDGGIAAAVAAAEEAVKHHDENDEDAKVRKRKERLEQNRIRYVPSSTIFTVPGAFMFLMV